MKLVTIIVLGIILVVGISYAFAGPFWPCVWPNTCH